MDTNLPSADRIDIWIDCDPGIDDALMLALVAASADRLHLHGVSSVAGNVPSSVVTENVLRLASYVGLPDVPLARGAVAPLVRLAQDAAEVHGASGLGAVTLPVSDRTLDARPAVIAMRDAILGLARDRRMTLVPTGPLTNIALLLRACPDCVERIERIVLMGGSTIGGNVTEHAEFNIWGDPEAAQIVFASGLPIVMCGLDVTLQCGLTPAQIDELACDEDARLRTLAQMLASYNQNESEWVHGVCVIHDAVTVLYLTNPELFGGAQAAVNVDCDEAHRGRTRCVAGPAATVLLLNEVDIQAFQRVLLDRLHRLPPVCNEGKGCA